MGIYVRVDLALGDVGTKSLGVLEILRQEPLIDRDRPNDETHNYMAKVSNGRITQGPVLFIHRYGDGAWVCIAKALKALGHG